MIQLVVYIILFTFTCAYIIEGSYGLALVYGFVTYIHLPARRKS